MKSEKDLLTRRLDCKEGVTGRDAARLGCRRPLHLEMKLLEEWIHQSVRKGSLHPGKSENPRVQGLLCPAGAVSGTAWCTVLPAPRTLHPTARAADVPAAAASRPSPLLGAAPHCIPLSADAINQRAQADNREPSLAVRLATALPFPNHVPLL